MSLPRVVNIKKGDDYDIYIGRGSEWGNPFVIGQHGDRYECIERYKDYLFQRPNLIEDLYYLAGKRLGCYCKPLACHGDVLVELYAEKFQCVL